MMTIYIGLGMVFLSYSGYVLLCMIGWRRSKNEKDDRAEHVDLNPFSVIIPVRNEEENIDQRILQLIQDIDQVKGSELIIVNDESSDGTMDVLRKRNDHGSLRVLNVNDGKGKKAAIRTGVLAANNEIIITTDGDVRSKDGWVNSVVEAFVQKDADMLLMPVLIKDGQDLLGEIQLMDQAILTGMAIGSAQMACPVWASGAALAFRKSDFLELEGFKGNEQWSSGDDVFLLHKFKSAGKKISVLNSSNALVVAEACGTWGQLIEQRLRWGSKSIAYRDPLTVFVTMLGLLRWSALIFLFVLLQLSIVVPSALWLLAIISIGADLILARTVLHSEGLKLPLLAQLFVPVFYLFFGVFLMVASVFYTPTWKGRKVLGQNQ